MKENNFSSFRFLCLWCLLLNACVTGPKYERPSIETPKAFKETNTEWKQADPKDALNKGKWWELFNDPQLNQLEEQVNTSNQNVAAAIANLRQAKALIKAARAQYYPTLSIAPSVTKSKGASSGNPNGTNETTTLFTLPLEASWVPDLWGKVQSAVKQSIANAQLNAADLENMRLSQQAELATTYYELRAQDELIRLFDSTVGAYEGSLKLNQVLLRTGIGSDETVVQAETQLKTIIAQSTNLKIARSQYEHAIALLIGKPAGNLIIEPTQLKENPPTVPITVPSTLLERRPDIAAAERGMAAANAAIGISTAAYYPQLSLSAAAGYNATSLKDLVNTPNFFWSLGATLSETIFDGGARSAQVEQYKAAYDSSVANYRQTVLTAFQQVEDSLASLHFLSIQKQQQYDAVEASQRYLQLATSRYKLGLDPYLNVLSAQITLLTNQQTDLNLKMQQLTSTVRLIESLGGGWDSSRLPTEKELLGDSADESKNKKKD